MLSTELTKLRIYSAYHIRNLAFRLGILDGHSSYSRFILCSLLKLFLHHSPPKEVRTRKLALSFNVVGLSFLTFLFPALPQVVEGQMVTDVSVAAGIFEVTSTWGAFPADYDNDGWEDLLIGKHTERPRLYRNVRGRFVQALRFSPWKDRHGCAWGDVNNDNLPDLYWTLGAERGTGRKANELWIQQSNHTFIEMGALYGVTDSLGRGRSAAFLDANRDGWLDLFVGNASQRTDGQPSPNMFFINQKGKRFRAAPEYGLSKNTGGVCAQAIDFNLDGWMDLLVCKHTGFALFRNEQGRRFVDVGPQSGILNDGAGHAILVDLNEDAFPDLVKIRPKEFYVQFQRNGRFGAPTARMALVSGRSAAAGDINGDTAPDLYITQGGVSPNEPDILLLRTGTGFTKKNIPPMSQGSGDTATPIDYDNDGDDEFVVLNGDGVHVGPIQLLKMK